jgi:hypothetical protein
MQPFIKKHLKGFNNVVEVEDIDFKLPERNLLVAILERAILDAVGIGRCNDPKDIRQARFWIMDEPLDNEPFTLGWICEHLDLEPKQIRDLYIKARSRLLIGEDLRWSVVIKDFRIKKMGRPKKRR